MESIKVLKIILALDFWVIQEKSDYTQSWLKVITDNTNIVNNIRGNCIFTNHK